MITLMRWLEKNGSQGRKALYEKIKEHYPRFTQTSLSQYLRGRDLTPSLELESLPILECHLWDPNGECCERNEACPSPRPWEGRSLAVGTDGGR